MLLLDLGLVSGPSSSSLAMCLDGLNLSAPLLLLVGCLNPFWATITKYLTLGYLLRKDVYFAHYSGE